MLFLLRISLTSELVFLSFVGLDSSLCLLPNFVMEMVLLLMLLSILALSGSGPRSIILTGL